jgi:hypothetical protein
VSRVGGATQVMQWCVLVSAGECWCVLIATLVAVTVLQRVRGAWIDIR